MSLSYRQLGEGASALAEKLRGAGVGPGDRVGVCLERGLDVPVALLAVLEAGGAYVALDPETLRDQLDSALAQSRIRVLITRRERLRSIRTDELNVLYLDDERSSARQAAASLSVPRARPEDVACVLFPRSPAGPAPGVMFRHSAVAQGLGALQERFRLSPHDRVLQWSPYGSIAHFRELFWPLIAGAHVIVPAPASHPDLDHLIDLIQVCQITSLHLAPTELDAFLHHPGAAGCSSITRVFSGGEPLRCRTRNLFFQVLDAELFHLYELAEVAPAASSWVCQRSSHRAYVPIGLPLPGARIHILDARSEPVPPGASGEIHIGGVALAEGYLDRPDMTAERFIADPFAGAPGPRLFRTGDRGRWDPDGNIEFLGRLDRRVEMGHGQVCLDEIEAALEQHPSLRQCAVEMDDIGQDRVLVGYFTVDGKAVTGEGLRDHFLRLHAGLPAPDRFFELEAFPFTREGRLDRRALSMTRRRGAPSAAMPLAPRTETERWIARMWEEILGVTGIGVDQSFFDLGGHSLHATTAFSRIRDQFGAGLTLAEFFEEPTVSGLSGLVDASRAGRPRPLSRILEQQRAFVRTWRGTRRAPDSLVVTLNPAGTLPGLFWCLQSQKALTQLAKHLGPDRPVHGMRSGAHVMPRTRKNIETLASHYAGEIAQLQPDGPLILGGNCQGGVIARSISRILRERGRRTALLVLLELETCEPHEDPVALIFGRESEYNPYGSGSDPDREFRSAYPAGYTVDFVEGVHNQFFESPYIESLATVLQRRLPRLPFFAG